VFEVLIRAIWYIGMCMALVGVLFTIATPPREDDRCKRHADELVFGGMSLWMGTTAVLTSLRHIWWAVGLCAVAAVFFGYMWWRSRKGRRKGRKSALKSFGYKARAARAKMARALRSLQPRVRVLRPIPPVA